MDSYIPRAIYHLTSRFKHALDSSLIDRQMLINNTLQMLVHHGLLLFEPLDGSEYGSKPGSW